MQQPDLKKLLSRAEARSVAVRFFEAMGIGFRLYDGSDDEIFAFGSADAPVTEDRHPVRLSGEQLGYVLGRPEPSR